MAKVRRIDWSPDEYLAGTAGVLTVNEHGVYAVVLMQIYSRGNACPNDLDFIEGHFKRPPSDHGRNRAWHQRQVGDALSGLIAKGKIRVSPDGQWLTNERADEELNRARERIHGAVRAGIISGSVRRTKPAVDQPWTSRGPAVGQPQLSNFNGLTRTSVRIINHQYDHESSSSKNLTGAARDPALNGGSGPRARRTETTKERVAALAAIARAKLTGTS